MNQKHTSCKCRWRFDSRKCNSHQKWNNNKCLCQCKNPKDHHVYKILLCVNVKMVDMQEVLQ